jgi:hypothetical protein
MAIKKKDKDKKDKSGKKREKTPWKAKQVMRFARLEKGLSKLNKAFKAARPPGINLDDLEVASTKVILVSGKVAALDDDWKPARGSNPGTSKKVGVGSTIYIRGDLDADSLKPYGDMLPKVEVFKGAKVTGEYDNRSWFVRCSDEMTRVVKKKHVALVTETE